MSTEQFVEQVARSFWDDLYENKILTVDPVEAGLQADVILAHWKSFVHPSGKNYLFVERERWLFSSTYIRHAIADGQAEATRLAVLAVLEWRKRMYPDCDDNSLIKILLKELCADNINSKIDYSKIISELEARIRPSEDPWANDVLKAT